jgi:hypothetical protein
VWNGQRIAVAWRGAAVPRVPALGVDLYGAELGGDGSILSRFFISSEPGDEGAPTLASAGAGSALVAYRRFRAAAPFSAGRVAARLLGPDACADSADCPTGFCVDGVCCDTECGGGEPLDCQACSITAGAPGNGVCALLKLLDFGIARASGGPGTI